jgi:hypothetical protein
LKLPKAVRYLLACFKLYPKSSGKKQIYGVFKGERCNKIISVGAGRDIAAHK